VWLRPIATTNTRRDCSAPPRQFGLRNGDARFPLHEADYNDAVNTVREAWGQQKFDNVRAEGAVLSTEETIAYAQRGRGERKRATTGWESLTPTERDVIRLVSEGLGNKRSPQGCSSHHARCRRTSPTSTPSSCLPRAYNWPRKLPATPDLKPHDTLGKAWRGLVVGNAAIRETNR
jgi:hypothetical protein